MTLRVDQLLHGYRKGHEQLAGSVRLDSVDADLVTRLSDLSGNLSGLGTFKPYLTVYPLPSRTHYAVARTRLDEEAPRAGCVLTHTLLVPLAEWEVLERPAVVVQLFDKAPPRDTTGLLTPLALEEDSQARPLPKTISDRPLLSTFVHKYFSEGLRPLVWFNEDHPDRILWQIVQALWPSLRSTFSACTLALQPRFLTDRPFELMFAPGVLHSRFSKIPAEHFLDGAAPLRTSPEHPEWVRQWTSTVFEDLPATKDTMQDWIRDMGDDPAAIRRLFMLKTVLSEPRPAPQALIGAMDLAESIARDAGRGIAMKSEIGQRAIDMAKEDERPAESLKLIDERLNRGSYDRVKESLGKRLTRAVAEMTQIDPSAALACVDPDFTRSTAFQQGVLLGLSETAKRAPGKLESLLDAPALATHVLSTDPDLAGRFLPVVTGPTATKAARTRFLDWLHRQHDPDFRRRIRQSVFSTASIDDQALMTELLKDLVPSEVSEILTATGKRDDFTWDSEAGAALAEQLGGEYPSETRAWLEAQDRQDAALAALHAPTFPRSKAGLTDLLSASRALPRVYAAELLARFMQRLGPRAPHWFLQQASADPALLDTLLSEEEPISKARIAQIQALLVDTHKLPIVQSPSLLERVARSAGQPYFSKLLDLTMRSLLTGYAAGDVTEASARSFQESSAAAAWFEDVSSREFTAAVTHEAMNSKLHWFNTWQWLTIAPNAVYARARQLIPDTIAALSRAPSSFWTPNVATMWVQVIERSSGARGHAGFRVQMRSQSLLFAFRHVRLPVSALVVDAFQEVYRTITETGVAPSEIAPLFSFLEWDKGRELRTSLIDSFMESEWAPGDLALAIGDMTLLRKIFKRLERKRDGLRYAERVSRDLESRSDPVARKLAGAWRAMVSNPRFYESWD